MKNMKEEKVASKICFKKELVQRYHAHQITLTRIRSTPSVPQERVPPLLNLKKQRLEQDQFWRIGYENRCLFNKICSATLREFKFRPPFSKPASHAILRR